MQEAKPHVCECSICQLGEDHSVIKLHQQINLLASRLDEQQRRWFIALEAKKVGHGGDRLLSQISGLHVDTIRRGRQELGDSLHGRPADRTRLPGGGQPALEKKTRPS